MPSSAINTFLGNRGKTRGNFPLVIAGLILDKPGYESFAPVAFSACACPDTQTLALPARYDLSARYLARIYD
jgi:hypothetical protein